MYLNNIINNSMDLNELKKLLDFEDIKTEHEKFVFFIDYFVNWFFNNHDIEKRTNKIGRPRYSEISLCKVLILASSEGITSGRKINTKLLFDTRYQKLMNYETPSYHLINDFKRKSHQIISDLFVDCVKFAQYYQFLDLSTIAIDGSKIRANASKSKILKMEDIYFLQYIFKQEKTQQFTNQIEKSHTISRKDKLIKEAQKYLIETKKEINKNNSKQKKKVRKGCINYFTKAIKSINHYTHAIIELDEMEQILTKSKQTSISTTDKEALWMLNKKGGTDFNYNIQSVNDTKTGIIIDINLIRDPIDLNSLIPEINNVQKNLNITLKNTVILADNGYYSEYALDYMENHNLTAIIPNRTQSMKVKPKNKENKPFGKVNFTYKAEEDTYICPNNKILPFQKEYFSNGTTKKLYYTTECKYCHNQTKCAGYNQYKTITEYGTESRKNMAIKFEDPKEKETYKKRSTIEIVFGNLIKNLEYRQTNSYGLQNVKTELTLLIIAINLKKIFNKITEN